MDADSESAGPEPHSSHKVRREVGNTTPVLPPRCHRAPSEKPAGRHASSLSLHSRALNTGPPTNRHPENLQFLPNVPES